MVEYGNEPIFDNVPAASKELLTPKWSKVTPKRLASFSKVKSNSLINSVQLKNLSYISKLRSSASWNIGGAKEMNIFNQKQKCWQD